MPSLAANNSDVIVSIGKGANKGKITARPYTSVPKWRRTFVFEQSPAGAAAFFKWLERYYYETAPSTREEISEVESVVKDLL